MPFFARLFAARRESDEYEAVLSALANDIARRQTKLADIRTRERRAALLVTLYALAAWGVYLALWYSPFLSRTALHALPVVVGPIAILFVRRIVQLWYKRKGDAEEKTVQELLAKQRSKVKEIKKKTNYETMRDLFQRYDDQPSPPAVATPLHKRTVPSTPLRARPLPTTPQQHQTPRVPLMQMQTPVYTPTRKQWFDKVADALLGDDEPPATSRFALICEKCFAHNGLAKESMWEDTKYVCPKCEHFNASPRAKRALALVASPDRPQRTVSEGHPRSEPHTRPDPKSSLGPETTPEAPPTSSEVHTRSGVEPNSDVQPRPEGVEPNSDVQSRPEGIELNSGVQPRAEGGLRLRHVTKSEDEQDGLTVDEGSMMDVDSS